MADVLPHNERAAATWSSGGRDYDRISEFVSDALAHLVSRVIPQPGERFLDVATGTGWTARLLSSRGATVIGVDIGAGVIEAAKMLAPTSISELPTLRNCHLMTPVSMRSRPPSAYVCSPTRKSLPVSWPASASGVAAWGF
jgi:methylase of polypeptide subunit release factors